MDGLKSYGRVLGRKMGFIALAWVVIYFMSQPFRGKNSEELNVLMLFAPLIGSIAGMVAGWYMATDAVEDAGFHGLPLWVLLVIGATGPMWIVEWILGRITHWPMAFGGFMELTFASLLALGAAVWMAATVWALCVANCENRASGAAPSA